MEGLLVVVGGFEWVVREGLGVSVDVFELGVGVVTSDSDEVGVGVLLFEVGENPLGQRVVADTTTEEGDGGEREMGQGCSQHSWLGVDYLYKI